VASNTSTTGAGRSTSSSELGVRAVAADKDAEGPARTTGIERARRVTPSPRPTYDGPSPIRAAQVSQHLWGDAEAGEVADWIYVSNEKIHHLVFGLPPGGAFRHSEDFRTIFAADELLYVLEGTLVIANPEIGEVHRVKAGQGVFFRRDTWHHAFSFGPDPLRVVEFFAPPPAAGASSAYARTKDLLSVSCYLDERWLGSWPDSKRERESGATLRIARDDDDLLWEVAGNNGDALIGLYVSTEQLTAGRIALRPGGRTGARLHGGDMSLHVLSGPLHVLLPDADGLARRWSELGAGEGFFLPSGTPYELFNMGAGEVATLFAVAPSYLGDR
jgi:mannose-6-phosphate isomerase-like protein (cupin superfamily)